MSNRHGNRTAGLSALGVVILLAATFAVFGRGWFAGSAASPGSSAAATTGGASATAASGAPAGGPAGGGYQPQDSQQTHRCDGLPPVTPGELRLLDPSATVTAAVICTDGYARIPGKGGWMVRRVVDVPLPALAGVVSAIKTPDRQPSSGACDAMGVTAPDLVLTLADGSRVRPGLPGDGCHVLEVVMKALGSASAGPARSTVRLSQVETEQEITSGCGGQAKEPSVWLEAGESEQPPHGSVADLLPAAGQVALCRYAPGDEPMVGSLAATGTADRASIVSAVGTIATTPPVHQPAECTSPPSLDHPPDTGWITIQALPAPGLDQPTPAPLLLVELGGCLRVVTGASPSLVGYLAADHSATLAALADHPAS